MRFATGATAIAKLKQCEYLENYPIFTAVSMRPGKTKLGAAQYLEDGKTLDCDMDEIAAQYKAWKKTATASGKKSTAAAKA